MKKNVGIFISYNILNSFRSSLPESLQLGSQFFKSPAIKSTQKAQFHYKLITVANSESSSVETRAKKIREQISREIASKNLDEFHLISSSLSGIDARFLLGHFPDLNRLCQTVVTVNAPNQGSTLADKYMAGKIDRFLMDRLSITFGMTPENFAECNSGNMADLTDFLDDWNDERIFTFGASKDYPSHKMLFKETSKILLDDITNQDFDCDGVLFPRESVLNPERNLGILNADFYEMSCFSKQGKSSGVFGLSIDFCKQRLG